METEKDWPRMSGGMEWSSLCTKHLFLNLQSDDGYCEVDELHELMCQFEDCNNWADYEIYPGVGKLSQQRGEK